MTMNHQLLLCCAVSAVQTSGRILTEVRDLRDLKGCAARAAPTSQETLCSLLWACLTGFTFRIFCHRVTRLAWALGCPGFTIGTGVRTGGRSASAALCSGHSQSTPLPWAPAGPLQPQRQQVWEAESRRRCPHTSRRGTTEVKFVTSVRRSSPARQRKPGVQHAGLAERRPASFPWVDATCCVTLSVSATRTFLGVPWFPFCPAELACRRIVKLTSPIPDGL